MADVILQMTDICKNFAGVKALDKVNFTLERGQIHALIGENGAGKSTLMKALLGINKIDSGEIVYRGKAVSFKNPHEALENGISMVHQEISLTHSMSISENIWMGRERKFTSFGVINNGKRQKMTEDLLRELGINLDPSVIVKNLTVANMQLVELARAISYEPDILILDEPTSALSSSEIELLFDIVKRLAGKGTAVIFISHKLNEIFSLCDCVTVMRDGQYITTRACTDISMDELITFVAGRELNRESREERTAPLGQEVLRVEHFSSQGLFEDVNFNVHAGEIIGFSGLMGAGRSEIMRAIYGLDAYDSGLIYYDGTPTKFRNPESAVAHGIGMVTEDRLRTGILPLLSVIYNTTIASMGSFSNFIFTNKKKERQLFGNAAKKMSIKYPSEEVAINKLSGGNQQKVILSRWIFNNPRVLILDEPTRGIDVGAKSEIHKLINGLSKQNIAIIVVSSEMPELLGLCDRIFVVRDGRIVFETPAADATQELLAKHAFGA